MRLVFIAAQSRHFGDEDRHQKILHGGAQLPAWCLPVAGSSKPVGRQRN